MRLELAGLNHRTAPVEVRERLAIGDDRLGEALERLRTQFAADEAVVLSTCNRVEAYGVGDLERFGPERLASFLADFNGLPLEAVRPHLYFHGGRAVVRHLFAAAAGIHSMVVGEPQILGQVKQAYLAAAEHQATGKVLHALFQAAMKAGKQARAHTAIGSGRVSVSSVAVELAHTIFGTLERRAVLVLGGGDMAEQALVHLLEAGAATALVANRTLERAKALAARHGGQAVPYDTLPERLADADVVIVSTAAPHFVLTRQQLRHALRRRRNAPLLVIDIAVPRNVEPDAADLDNVFLYDIDDLESVVSRNRREREQAIVDAFALVERHAAEFVAQLGIFAIEPLIARLDRRAALVRDAELERLLARLPHLADADRDAIRHAAARIVNKLLHQPKLALRHHADSPRHRQLADAIAQLFALEGQGDRTPPAAPRPPPSPPAQQ